MFCQSKHVIQKLQTSTFRVLLLYSERYKYLQLCQNYLTDKNNQLRRCKVHSESLLTALKCRDLLVNQLILKGIGWVRDAGVNEGLRASQH